MDMPPCCYTGTLYHGSPYRPDAQAFGDRDNTLPRIRAGRPFWATDNHPYAVRFARGGLVSTLEVRLERVFDLTDEANLEAMLALYNADPSITPWDDMTDGEIADSAYFLLDSPTVMRHLIEQGFDGAYLREDLELRVFSYAILQADRVRLVTTQPA